MSKNSLYFNLPDTAGHITLDSSVPAQQIALKWASVQFASNAVALANPVVFFDVDWLDGLQVHDNITTGYRLPLITGSIGSGMTTSSYSPDISMAIHKDIPRYFGYRITDAAGVTVSDAVVTAVHLVFEYKFGAI